MFPLESTSLSLSCCGSACGPNMTAPLRAFRGEYYLRHSDWLRLHRWLAAHSPPWRLNTPPNHDCPVTHSKREHPLRRAVWQPGGATLLATLKRLGWATSSSAWGKRVLLEMNIKRKKKIFIIILCGCSALFQFCFVQFHKELFETL